jgi:VanZ family protein
VPAPQRRLFVTRWIPVIAWMTLIFIASSDPESGPRGSRLLGPILYWLIPDLAPATFERIGLVIRKLIHFGTYGILASLLWRALATGKPTSGQGSTRPAWIALTAAAIYAVTDELHQSFVPSRVGSAYDVLIDTAGAATALLLIQEWRRRRAGG